VSSKRTSETAASGSTRRPLLLGVTGNIGSGKSAVARLLAGHGAAVIDADRLARAASEDPLVLQQIAGTISSQLVKDGALDRTATATLVFSDPAALEKLNAIIHPWVRRESERRVQQLLDSAEPPRVIAQDIPLLFENGLERQLDRVLVVSAPLELRAARVAGRSGLTLEQVRERDAAQWPLERKVALADYVIDNSSTEGTLAQAVQLLWQKLLQQQDLTS
jgi:dephospho-CoA kinase